MESENQKLLLSPAEIADACIAVGKTKAALSPLRALWLGVMAGMFIAFAGVGSTFAGVYVNKLAGACVFPGGLAMVLLAGSELFTGNCMMTAALHRREITLGAMLRNWLFVYIGNLLGAVFVAGCCTLAGTFDGIAETVVSAAAGKAGLPILSAVLRGVLCNVLVCIAVWMSFGAKTAGGKIAALYFPILLFVAAGFEHSVANMYYLPAGLFTAARLGMTAEGLTAANAVFRNLLPVTLGNILGGAGIVALGYSLVYGKKNG